MRTQSVEVFSSALCLATLCGTYFLEVLPQIMEPTEKRFPLVSTVVGVLSVLHNALVLGLTWARLPGGGPDHGAIGRGNLPSSIKQLLPVGTQPRDRMIASSVGDQCGVDAAGRSITYLFLFVSTPLL